MLPKKKCEKVPFLRLLLVASEISWRLKNVPGNFGHTWVWYSGTVGNSPSNQWETIWIAMSVFSSVWSCTVLTSRRKKLVWPWHSQTNTAMVLCISWGYLTTPKIVSENDKCTCAFTAKLWSHKFTNWQKTTPLHMCQQYSYEYYLTSTTLKWYMT